MAEVKLQASKIGLPPREAEKFFWRYEATGWCWGRNVRIKSWTAALAGWKLNWEDKRIVENEGSANDVKREMGRWKK
jgi:hypothetical protein